MTKKIIVIVVTVVFVAGAATGLGVVIKQTNDKNTEELVSAAVSEAMATSETTTETETTQPTTEKNTDATTKKTPAEEYQTVYNTDNGENIQIITAPDGRGEYATEKKVYKVENSQQQEQPDDEYPIDGALHDENGYYWATNRTYVPDDSDTEHTKMFYPYYIDENREMFYFDDKGKRVYK